MIAQTSVLPCLHGSAWQCQNFNISQFPLTLYGFAWFSGRIGLNTATLNGNENEQLLKYVLLYTIIINHGVTHLFDTLGARNKHLVLHGRMSQQN